MVSASVERPAPSHPAGAPWAVRDAAAFLGVSARHLVRLLDAEKVASFNLGRRRLIADAEVRRVASSGVN